MIRTERFAYADNDGQHREVMQIWGRIPATGVWTILSTQPVEIDPNRVPVFPTR